jgi:hypothetical protein
MSNSTGSMAKMREPRGQRVLLTGKRGIAMMWLVPMPEMRMRAV